MDRPRVDVVVPFIGSTAALDHLRERLAGLELRPDDVYSSSQQFHHLGGVGLLMVAMAVGARFPLV